MRKCIFNGEEMTFHGVFQVSQIIAPSMLQGGHNGGVVAEPMVVVESKEGKLYTVRTQDVELLQNKLLRPCKVKEKGTERFGVFHEWSQDYEEFESGPANFPVGIVEFDDGTVHSVYAGNIIFSDDGELI